MTITSNKSKRTFTIRKENVKYRTLNFSKQEFEEMEFNTEEDWLSFLKRNSGEYYVVK
jgi:hypothetical protein